MRNGVGLGVSTDMPSKQSAVDTALHDCIGKGGQACKIQLVYVNQCGVIVEGEKGSARPGARRSRRRRGRA